MENGGFDMKTVQELFPDWQKMDNVDSMSGDQFDNLPFGAIQLDADGTILRFNATEGRLAGRDPAVVTGKNFFDEVAPCTNVQEFAGAFKEGVEKKNLNKVFPYRFDFQMDPTDVWVRLFYSDATGSAWVFVSRAEG